MSPTVNPPTHPDAKTKINPKARAAFSIQDYVGKTPIKFNIPEAEAVDRLVDLIRDHGKWVERDPG